MQRLPPLSSSHGRDCSQVRFIFLLSVIKQLKFLPDVCIVSAMIRAMKRASTTVYKDCNLVFQLVPSRLFRSLRPNWDRGTKKWPEQKRKREKKRKKRRGCPNVLLRMARKVIHSLDRFLTSLTVMQPVGIEFQYRSQKSNVYLLNQSFD